MVTLGFLGITFHPEVSLHLSFQSILSSMSALYTPELIFCTVLQAVVSQQCRRVDRCNPSQHWISSGNTTLRLIIQHLLNKGDPLSHN